MIHFTSRVVGKVEIGEHVWKSFAISGGCYVQGLNGVTIGDDTLFGPNVVIISSNHDESDLRRSAEGPPVRIGRECWIGANAVLLPGVELGDGVIVGAGAVVTRSFEAGAVIAGVPARRIRDRIAGGISS
jgi:acetyltransferase-like isoleucine patch superfamily enzyme